jgi:hypothetical protein
MFIHNRTNIGSKKVSSTKKMRIKITDLKRAGGFQGRLEIRPGQGQLRSSHMLSGAENASRTAAGDSQSGEALVLFVRA